MTTAQKLLEPYIAGPPGGKNGDHPMICPVHEDSVRSATVNFPKRIWWCAVCGGGKLSELIDRKDEWYEPSASAVGSGSGAVFGAVTQGPTRALPTEDRLDGYRSRLQSDEWAMNYLQKVRGLKIETIVKRGIGFNGHTGKFVIPIYNSENRCINVRYHKPGGKPKWVNTPGFGSPATLHPMDVIESSDELVWVEGEFDSYITTQEGWPAFTATGGAKIVWQDDWNDILKGKRIILCFDADNEGRAAIHRILPHLKKIAASVQIAKLPYKVEPKHGKDITDWWLEGNIAANFKRLIVSVKAQAPEHDFQEVTYDALRGEAMRNKPVAVKATVAGMEGPYLQMPTKIEAVCSMDWKPATCDFCPLGPKRKNGTGTYKVTPTDQLQLDLLYKRGAELEPLFKKHMGVPVKCPVVEIEYESRAAWHGEVRNGSNISADALPILLFTKNAPDMGTTIELHGELKAQPRQTSVFVAGSMRKVNAELDNFQLSKEQADDIREVMGALSNDPRAALDDMARFTEDHVTKRYGQRWLHICADLVYHSVISFYFKDELINRGWMELLAVGETRVGKSSTLKKLAAWYDKGEIVPCEKVSIAGLIATSEKRSSGRGDNWSARIGKIPLLDRQLIVLDEAQGLNPEQIGQMSDARSEGIIKVTQASQVEVPARVRMIWLANARQDGISGVKALAQLMGKTEDLARTDFPLWVTKSLTPEETDRWNSSDPGYNSPLDRAVARNLLFWAWSRGPRDVIWHPGSTAMVLEISDVLAKKYASRIPVMPALEARIRVARLAVAIAARLFSTDSTARKVKVLSKHVRAAGWVYANLFKHPDLEYLTEVRDKQISDESGKLYAGELAALIREEPWLRSFLMMSNPSTRQVGQMLGQDSSHFLRKLTSLNALEPNEASWTVPDWARKIAQRTRGK
jgi:MCM2/3/5 family protein/Toprim domain-containing protein